MIRKVIFWVSIVTVLSVLSVGELSICSQRCFAQKIIAKPKKQTEQKKSTPKKNNTPAVKHNKENSKKDVPKINWGSPKENIKNPDEAVEMPGKSMPKESAPELQVQEEPKVTEPAQPVVNEEPKDKIFEIVEQMAQFPGGQAALMKWIASRLMYPAAAAEEGVEGRVIVEFVITKDGRVTDAKVVRSLHPALDREALRVVNSLPRWTPGYQDGKPVNTIYTLPINFKLQH